jgi:hypothetical protein
MFNKEEEKFHSDQEDSLKERNLKLLIDFDSEDKSLPKKQMEIGDIKYKKRKKISVKEVDLRKNKKANNSIF